jgi:hypothetical protein
MAWECLGLLEFFFCFVGVIGTGAESKSFPVQRANAATGEAKL